MIKTRKNKKRITKQLKKNNIKEFALSFKAAPELFNHIEQLNRLTSILKEQLYKNMEEKEYEPVNEKAKIILCIDLNPNPEKYAYRISVLGKPKKKDGINNVS